MKLRSGLLLAALAGVGALAAGCADDKLLTSDLHQANDFGRAVNEDLAAQIADPDATYRGPPPPSSGERAALATKHYGTDTVKQPVAQTTETEVSSGGSGGGSSGSGGGAGGP
jgi:type IV pilus biogenesis protein CpaD/CtpE